jgi:hypothetical protein
MSSPKGIGGSVREGTRVVLKEITASLHNSPPIQPPRRKVLSHRIIMILDFYFDFAFYIILYYNYENFRARAACARARPRSAIMRFPLIPRVELITRLHAQRKRTAAAHSYRRYTFSFYSFFPSLPLSSLVFASDSRTAGECMPL